MRDSIKELITEAEAKVTEFENHIFSNDRGFYMNAKLLIDDMIEQIGLIKQTVEIEDYSQELYDANKEDLDFIIDTINQLQELVKTKTIHIIVEGKGNYRVQVLGDKVTEDTEDTIETIIPANDTDSLDSSAIDEFLDNN
jgi:undecaprenyl pyrophosphate synthase